MLTARLRAHRPAWSGSPRIVVTYSAGVPSWSVDLGECAGDRCTYCSAWQRLCGFESPGARRAAAGPHAVALRPADWGNGVVLRRVLVGVRGDRRLVVGAGPGCLLSLASTQVALLGHDSGHQQITATRTGNCVQHRIPYTETGLFASYACALRYLHALGEPLRASHLSRSKA